MVWVSNVRIRLCIVGYWTDALCSDVCSQAIPRPPVKRAAAIGLANGCED